VSDSADKVIKLFQALQISSRFFCLPTCQKQPYPDINANVLGGTNTGGTNTGGNSGGNDGGDGDE